MVNLNIAIPEETHKRLKLRALEEDKTLKDLVIQLLEEVVQNEKT